MIRDKFEQLAADAQLCVCVLGNADVTDIELVNLNSVPLPDETVREFNGRGLHFVGTIGVVNGSPLTALAEPLDAVRIAALAAAFTSYCEALLEDTLEQQRKGDEIAWLRQLWGKADPR